jgi:uncharacterized SAM-binding protein YcdF (DUF218 family)
VNSFPTGDVLAAARSIFAYLSAVDLFPDTPADAVIGFGTFDVTLASFCGDLYAQQRARRIVFTGGIGAGTADLGRPEADAWREQLARTHPTIPFQHIITESRSTNTAENIAFTAALLSRIDPAFTFGRGLHDALIVASPSRLRRVKLTLQRLQPKLRVTRCLPAGMNFEHEYVLYHAKGIDYLAHLAGELDRIISYPARGWIAADPVPAAVVNACATLREH